MADREVKKGRGSKVIAPQPPAISEGSSEDRNWHLSWIIAALTAIGVAAIVAWTGLLMIPVILIVTIALLLILALLWIATPRRFHVLAKAVASLIFVGCAASAVWWAISYDRPILPPEMEVAVLQDTSETGFILDLEVLVKNSGHQSGYVDKWRLDLTMDGSTVVGRQLFGQQIPPVAANESGISEQEFLIGKPVRGWLFFSFATISHEYAASYFACGSPTLDKVKLTLSVWDSKTKREWDQTKSLRELGKNGCISPEDVQPPPQSRTSATGSHQKANVTEAEAQQIIFKLGDEYILHHSGDIGDKQRWINAQLKKNGYSFQFTYKKVPPLSLGANRADPCPLGRVEIDNFQSFGTTNAFATEGKTPCLTIRNPTVVGGTNGLLTKDKPSDSSTPPITVPLSPSPVPQTTTTGPISQNSSGPCSPNVVGGNASVSCSTGPIPNQMTKAYNCVGYYNSYGVVDGSQVAQAGPPKNAQMDSFDRMVNLNNVGLLANAAKLLEECQSQIRVAPEWLTPNLFCALASSAMGRKNQERLYFEKFEQGKGNGYKSQPQCSQIEKIIQSDLNPQ